MIIIYLAFLINIPFPITLCVKLCLNSVKNPPLFINDNDDNIDLPYEISDNWDMKRIINNCIYDYIEEERNSYV